MLVQLTQASAGIHRDELTRECLAMHVSRRMTSQDFLERLSDLFIYRGPPEYTRLDNGPEFTVHLVQEWLENAGVKTLSIEPGSPLENGFIESFNGKQRDELLNREIFETLLEVKVLIGRYGVDDKRCDSTAHQVTDHRLQRLFSRPVTAIKIIT